jgi:hypothetical protein
LSGCLCDLPVGEPDPVEQLLMIRRGMEQNRSTGGSCGPGAVPILADRLPPSVLRVTAPVAGHVVAVRPHGDQHPGAKHSLHPRWCGAGRNFPDRATSSRPGLGHWAFLVSRPRLRGLERRSGWSARRATPRRGYPACGNCAGQPEGVNDSGLAALRVNAGDSSYPGELGSPGANFRR